MAVLDDPGLELGLSQDEEGLDLVLVLHKLHLSQVDVGRRRHKVNPKARRKMKNIHIWDMQLFIYVYSIILNWNKASL